MNSIDGLISLIRDGLGLPLSREDASRELDQIPGWDSVHLLWLITALERTTGRRLSMPDLLEATSLERIYELVAG